MFFFVNPLAHGQLRYRQFVDKPGREPYGDEPSPINSFERKVRSSIPYYYFIYVTNRVVGLVGRTVNLLLLWKIRWKTQNNP